MASKNEECKDKEELIVRKQETNVTQGALWPLINIVCMQTDLEASVVLNWNAFIKWTSSYEDRNFMYFKCIYLDKKLIYFITHILMIKFVANHK